MTPSLRALVACVCCFAIGCASATPPPATPPPQDFPTPRLKLGQADWDPPSGARVVIRPNGDIYEGNQLVLIIDTTGRIFNARRQPWAQLSEDGYVFGPDELSYGHVGPQHASTFDGDHLWLTIERNGQVTFLDAEGKRTPGGRWHGCEGPMLPTCTAVTHALALRRYLRPPSSAGSSAGNFLPELVFRLVVALVLGAV